jgi:hypothetical protein
MPRVGDAAQKFRVAVTRGASMRLLAGESYWIALLGEACARRGRVEDAASLLDRALALCRERRERGYETWVLRIVGEIALLGDPPDTEKAAAVFREAPPLAEELSMGPLHAHSDLGQAEGHLAAAAGMYRKMDMGFWLATAEAARRELT